MRNQSDSSPIRELEWPYGKSQAEYGKKKSGKSAGFGIKRLVNQGWFLKFHHLIGLNSIMNKPIRNQDLKS